MGKISRYEVSGFAMRPLQDGERCDENRFIEVVSKFDLDATIAAKDAEIEQLKKELECIRHLAKDALKLKMNCFDGGWSQHLKALRLISSEE